MLEVYDNSEVASVIRNAVSEITTIIGRPVSIKVYAKDSTEEQVDFIRAVICDVCCVSWKRIISKTRTRDVVTARHFYCHYARNFLGHSLKRIATDIVRDHTTVIHGCKTIDDLLFSDADIKIMDGEIKKQLNQNEAQAQTN